MTWIVRWLLVALIVGCNSSSPEKRDDYVDKMATEHKDDAPVQNDATVVIETRAVVGDTRKFYVGDDREYSGYLVQPVGDVNGAVIMIHEWWGLNDNIQDMASKLASETGYRVLAIDLYGGESASEPEKAKKLMMKAMSSPDAAKDVLEKAFEFLREQGSEKIAVMGWCFGGHWTLQATMLFGDRIDGAVVYYGKLETDKTKLQKIAVPVLGIFGEKDQGIPVASVNAFKSAMDELQKPVDIHIFPGADHAFANPSGTKYNAKAAEDAWQKTLDYLRQRLDGHRAL